ncbi:MAG: hypothetical protein WKF56_01560 [Candidatus Limnocylindrales bacterium]
MNAEFNWWLLIVGLVLGAGLVWFVLADTRRREVDVAATERALEAAWLSAGLADEGLAVSPEVAERLLELHQLYLESPPAEVQPEAPAVNGGSSTGLEATHDDGLGVQRGSADVRE